MRIKLSPMILSLFSLRGSMSLYEPKVPRAQEDKLLESVDDKENFTTIVVLLFVLRVQHLSDNTHFKSINIWCNAAMTTEIAGNITFQKLLTVVKP